MQYTPNYNLITVEGTDVVNPLVQMNPNFTDIDAAMFANKQSVIGTATEITAGTVHSITRANADSNYFRFTATSNWSLGDSMSVDGVNVSVYLSDGTAPGTGAYVINTEVLALLSGSRVTLITSNGIIAMAASDVTYDNTGSGLTASDVQDAIDEINTNLPGNDGSVSVTGDGIKTYGQICTELFSLINASNVSHKSFLEWDSGATKFYSPLCRQGSDYGFEFSNPNGRNYFKISSASEVNSFTYSTAAYSDASTAVFPSGNILTLYY